MMMMKKKKKKKKMMMILLGAASRSGAAEIYYPVASPQAVQGQSENCREMERLRGL